MAVLKYTTKYVILGVLAPIVCQGNFDITYPKEKSKKLEVWRASGDIETDMAKQVEIITEGLDALPAAIVLMHYGGIHREAAKAHFEKALVDNPDDFYALRYWAGLIKADNPAEAESIYRLPPYSFTR